MPGLLDALVVAFIVIVVPLEAAVESRRLQRAVAAGVPNARLIAYRQTLAWQWGAAAILLIIWVSLGRSFNLLGFGLPSGRGFFIAAAIALVIVLLLLAQLRAAQSRPEVAEQVRAAAASVQHLLPSTPAEIQRFTWVGITAGVVEELIYRGFMMWFVAAFAPAWVALAATSLAFGIGHTYQGASGIAKTTAVGAVVGGLYLLAGSIVVPMLVHVAVDVVNGRMVYGASVAALEKQT